MADSEWNKQKEKYIKTKLRAANQEEWPHKSKEHFIELFGNPSEITDKTI